MSLLDTDPPGRKLAALTAINAPAPCRQDREDLGHLRYELLDLIGRAERFLSQIDGLETQRSQCRKVAVDTNGTKQ